MRYDNLKPAVHKILTGKNRQEQAAWVAFRSHFLFESEYVTPGRGQEKGGVENLVGYGRRNFLVPLPEFRILPNSMPIFWTAVSGMPAAPTLWPDGAGSLGGGAGSSGALPAKLPEACVSHRQGQPAPTGALGWELVFGAAGICRPPGDRPRLRLQGDHCLPG